MGVLLSGEIECEDASEAEISEFEDALVIEEQVLGFEVAVNDTMLMAMSQTEHKLILERLHHHLL